MKVEPFYLTIALFMVLFLTGCVGQIITPTPRGEIISPPTQAEETPVQSAPGCGGTGPGFI